MSQATARRGRARGTGEEPRVYADQNERDHRSLLDAIASGRIKAESGL